MLMPRAARVAFSCALISSVFSIIPASPFLSNAQGADWPQWLGARRDGSTTDAIEPWKEIPKPTWSAKVGFGFSCPVVSAGRVFVHARVSGQEREEMICFDAATGKEHWRTAYDRATYSSILNTGPQATPIVSGGKVFGFGITGVLSCFDAESGKLVWLVDTFKKLNQNLPRYGVCCSPVVIGNRVIVAVAGKGSAIVAFDTKTGEIAWQTLDEPANTSSPLLVASQSGQAPDVVFMTSLRVAGLNPLDGSVNWEYPLPFHPSGTAPTPILSGDLIFTSTMDNGTTGIRLKDQQAPEKSWQAKDLSGYFSTGVASKDRLFLVTNVLKPIPRADLVCVESQTGKSVWKKTGLGYFHFGLIRTANDKLLLLDDSGKLRLLDSASEKFRELCSGNVCGGTLVSPVLANGCIFARDADKIVCVRLAAAPSPAP